MGLGYTYQNTLVLIGSKTGTTRTAVALTTGYDVANKTKSFPTGGISKVNFSISYTTGAAETNNNLDIRVRTSPADDRTNWYQIPNESVSGGVSTLTLREFTFVGASGATEYAFSLPIDVQDEYTEISVKESNVASAAGTVYVEATLSGSAGKF